jgi:tetratricopeptide (TPR) repeat protein
MKSIAKLKDEARKHEQKEEWEKAIQVYLQVLRVAEGREAEVELPLYNRVGDLCVRLGRPLEAVQHYETAADRYAEAGLYNNAIALCNKALRYDPDHLPLMRKLGQFSASQGFVTDARRYFLEYAERKFTSGETNEALSALEDFADVSDDPEVRELLGRRLHAYGRTAEAVHELQRAYTMRVAAGQADLAQALKAEIEALDPDAGPDDTSAHGPAGATYTDALPGLVDFDSGSAIEGFDVDPDEGDGGTIDGFETGRGDDAAPVTDAGLGFQMEEFGASAEDDADIDVGMVEGLESTSLDFGAAAASIGGLGEDLGIEHEESVFDLPRLDEDDDSAFDLPGADGDSASDFGLPMLGEDDDASFELPTLGFDDDDAPGALPTLDSGDDDPFELPTLGFDDDDDASGALPTLDSTDDDAPFELPAIETDAAPPFELQTFETGADTPAFDMPEPAADDDEPAFELPSLTADDDTAFDLPSFGTGGDDDDALPPFDASVFDMPALDDLDTPEADDDPFAFPLPDLDPGDLEPPAPVAEDVQPSIGAGFELVEADYSWTRPAEPADEPVEAEPADGAWPDIDAAIAGEPRSEDPWFEAPAPEAADEPADDDGWEGLDAPPADVPHAAPEDVADVADVADAEHAEPEIEAAGQPEAWIPDWVDEAPAVDATPDAQPDDADVAGQAAPETVEPAASDGGWTPDMSMPAPEVPAAPAPPAGPRSTATPRDGFIDLGSLLSEDDEDTTRFRVQETAPTGDEDRDFAELLSQFKAKVSEHVPAEDAAAHYDLGIAFKEMGLVDEAISEFQVALRSGHMKLKVHEELGHCFLQKEQYNIAEKVLSRALEMKYDDELELLGVYYHLGRAYEGMGRKEQARDAYERVLGMDINFQDVTDRLARL